MNQILSYISQYFRIFLIWAIFIWIYFPIFSWLIEPYLHLLLMGIMYLWCLTITKEQLYSVWKNRKSVFWYLLVWMILCPVLVFIVAQKFIPDWSIGLFLLTAAPAWVASIALSSIVKWNSSLVATITILSSIMCVFTIPLLSELLIGAEIQIDSLAILRSLCKRVVVPFILAQLSLPYLKGKETYKKYISPLTILLLMPIIRWPIWANSETYAELSLTYIVWWSLWLFLLSALLHFIWWQAFRNGTHQDKIWWSLGLWYMNVTLAILLATTYFDAQTVLVVLLYELPRDLMLIPFAWVSKRLQ